MQAVAIGLLARREHSTLELQQKLQLRGYENREIIPVLESLQQKGWLSDTRYAATYTQYRMEKGYGPLRIMQELRHKGIPAIIAEEALASYASSQWYATAQRYYQKKFHKPASDREQLKQWQHMKFRGFDSETIQAILNPKNEDYLPNHDGGGL